MGENNSWVKTLSSCWIKGRLHIPRAMLYQRTASVGLRKNRDIRNEAVIKTLEK